MLQVLGCTVATSLLHQWYRFFVSEVEPYFLSVDLLCWLPREVLVLSRDEFWALNLAREYRDSYTAYRVQPAATHMAFMTSEEVEGLSTTGREALLRAQWSFRRGQLWAWDVVQSMDLSPSWCAAAAQRSVETEDGTKVALDARLWWMLSDAERTSWLAHFIETEGLPSVTAMSNLQDWAVVERNTQPAVRSLSNTFATTSGPNCFSTTLAGATTNPATVCAIAELWLHQGPFLRGLNERGYRVDSTSTPDESAGGDVLVWRDEVGKAVHACYVIGDGLVLNKNGQAWYEPRQVLYLSDVLTVRRDDGAKVEVCKQQHTGRAR